MQGLVVALYNGDLGSPQDGPQSYALTVTSVDTMFLTEDHFIASVEMQLSGEPLGPPFVGLGGAAVHVPAAPADANAAIAIATEAPTRP